MTCDMQKFLSFQVLVLNSDLMLPNTSRLSLYFKPISFAMLYAVKIVSWFKIWSKHEVSFCCFLDLIVNYSSIC